MAGAAGGVILASCSGLYAPNRSGPSHSSGSYRSTRSVSFFPVASLDDRSPPVSDSTALFLLFSGAGVSA